MIFQATSEKCIRRQVINNNFNRFSITGFQGGSFLFLLTVNRWILSICLIFFPQNNTDSYRIGRWNTQMRLTSEIGCEVDLPGLLYLLSAGFLFLCFLLSGFWVKPWFTLLSNSKTARKRILEMLKIWLFIIELLQDAKFINISRS